MVNMFAWIIFGIMVGITANLIDPYPAKGGLIEAIILGILGSVLGGFLGNVVFGIGISGLSLTSFAVAVLGSLLLLFVSRAFGKEVRSKV